MKLPRFAPLFLATMMLSTLSAAEPNPAASAINDFGVALHQRLAAKAPDGNLCTSPYSIETALGMTYAGAAGETRDEMAKVLQFAPDDKIHGAFSTFDRALLALADKSARASAEQKKYGGRMEPIVLTTANRLFGKKDCAFQETFLDLLTQTYRAPLERVDFAANPALATAYINNWVETKTAQRIRNLIPGGAIQATTELVLVNAIYIKAPWAQSFNENVTQPAPFHFLDGKQKNVPTMMQQRHHGFAQRDGFRAVTMAYGDGDLQFLILLPDDAKGLPALEQKLTGALLAKQAELPSAELQLYLPKFKLEPPTLALSGELQAMGMKRAFNIPEGSADFSKMATRPNGQGLVIGEVFHKTFFAVDEKGTEAAAATAVLMAPGAAPRTERPKPVEVMVDHPFLFAIQHRATGGCLFLGRVTNP